MGTPRDTSKPHPSVSPDTALGYVVKQLELSGVRVEPGANQRAFTLGQHTFSVWEMEPGLCRLGVETETGLYTADSFGLDYITQLGRIIKAAKSAYTLRAIRLNEATLALQELKGVHLEKPNND